MASGSFAWMAQYVPAAAPPMAAPAAAHGHDVGPECACPGVDSILRSRTTSPANPQADECATGRMSDAGGMHETLVDNDLRDDSTLSMHWSATGAILLQELRRGRANTDESA